MIKLEDILALVAKEDTILTGTLWYDNSSHKIEKFVKKGHELLGKLTTNLTGPETLISVIEAENPFLRVLFIYNKKDFDIKYTYKEE
jgi:hypothetical protein